MSSNPQSLILFLELCLYKTFFFSTIVSSHIMSFLMSQVLLCSAFCPPLLSSCLFLTHVVSDFFCCLFLRCYIFFVLFLLIFSYQLCFLYSLISPSLTSFFCLISSLLFLSAPASSSAFFLFYLF